MATEVSREDLDDYRDQKIIDLEKKLSQREKKIAALGKELYKHHKRLRELNGLRTAIARISAEWAIGANEGFEDFHDVVKHHLGDAICEKALREYKNDNTANSERKENEHCNQKL